MSPADDEPATLATPLRALIAVLVAIGVLARLSPLFDTEGRLLWQYMTEDGYLMQTIARNMAIGLGMSTAEGTIGTNGVQPLATFFFAGLFKLAGGDKTVGIGLVTAFSAAIAIASAYFFFRVATRLLSGLPGGRSIAAFAAASWFCGPLLIRHSMNGLETGVYYLALLITLDHYLSRPRRTTGALTTVERFTFGALLGVTFLSRNDAVFFIGGLLLMHVVLGPRDAFVVRAVDAVVAGVTSLVVASPWLIYNYTQFGSIIPISGTAQSHNSHLGQNLPWLPASLFESTFIFTPLPNSVEHSIPVMLLALGLVGFIAVSFWRAVRDTSLHTRRVLAGYALYGAGVCTYYGLFFGAPWFIPRYLSPQAIMLWMGTVVTVVVLVRRAGEKMPQLRAVGPLLAVLATVAAGAFAAQQFKNGTYHMHKQVVQWTDANATKDVWLGGVQTGTLGFFHDRTINLDGKVNPEALEVARRDGHVLDYVVQSKIEYVVDWIGVADWPNHPEQSQRFHDEFEVLVKDAEHNLAVLHRKGPR